MHFKYIQGTIQKDFDSVKESSRPERAIVFSTWAGQAASSVEADITGGSNVSSQAQSKQESSKNYTFMKGIYTF